LHDLGALTSHGVVAESLPLEACLRESVLDICVRLNLATCCLKLVVEFYSYVSAVHVPPDIVNHLLCRLL